MKTRSRRRWLRRCALAAAAWAASLPAAAQGDPFDLCYAACVAAGCRLSSSTPAVGPAYVLLEACSRQSVAGGAVRLRYRHKGQWFSPPSAAAAPTALAALLERFPPDPCPVPTPGCLQQRMSSRVASIGGHGIDGQASRPGGSGEPCAIGLPCGRIAVPGTPWRFTLTDGAAHGVWTVRIARGASPPGVPGEFGVEVVDGQVQTDGARFSPGASYVYRLSFPDGSTRATGEFSLLSRPLMVALRSAAARRVAEGQNEADAWVDALAANELDWDAWQAMQDRR